MHYVITATSWRNVNPDFDESELKEGESLVDQLPQWLIDWDAQFWESKREADEQLAWQAEEIVFINNQLMAIEEEAETCEETGALPGTRSQWLSHRTKVRNWKDGAEGFPETDRHPARPS